MNASTRIRPFSAPALPDTGAIEWEEMPSLAKRLVKDEGGDPRLHAHARAEPTWGETTPAGFDETMHASAEFVEKVEGLATREVVEPDVFSYFFGRNAED